MEPWQWAIYLRPFVLLAVILLVCLPIRLAAQRYLPEGKVKRLLLRRIGP